MSRLISTRELNNVVMKRSKEYGKLAVEVENIVEEMVRETPTAQATIIDQIKKLRTEFDNSLNYYYTHSNFAPYTVMQYVLEQIDELLKPYE